MQSMTGTALKTGVLAIALALAGCGGGGGDSSPDAGTPIATNPSPVAERTIQGTAAKGLIKNAKVAVYALDAQGVRGAAALATATTGADGAYKLQLAASVLNFVIEVSGGTGAVMADEVTGTDIAIPEGMKLRSVVTLANNAAATYEGTVSPLTEMVARTAQTSDGKLPLQAVTQAKASVRTLLGFDPETVKPINSNSAAAVGATEEEKNQSLALAAISKMGSAASADCAQSVPGERISCVVNALAGSVKVADGKATFDQNRLVQFRDAIQAVTEDKNINRTGKDKVVGIPVLGQEPGTAIPVPTPTPTTPVLSPVEATRALFGSLRTNLRAIDEGDAFRSTVDAIQSDLTDAVAPLGNDVSGLATLVMSAVDRMDAIRAGGNWSHSAANVFDNIIYDSPVRGGVPYNGDGACAIVLQPLSMTCTVAQRTYLQGTAANFYPNGQTVYAARVFRIAPKGDSATDYSYTAHLEKITVQYKNYAPVSGSEVREPIGGSHSGDITIARSGDMLSQLVVKGGMTGRLHSDGSLASDYEDWTLKASRTELGAGLFTYRFGGEFSAFKAGQPSGKIVIDDSSFLRLALANSTSGKVLPSFANTLQVTLRGAVADTVVDGTLLVADGRFDKSQTSYLPTKLIFTGALQHKNATVFSGKVSLARNGYQNYDASAAESDSNFVADAIELSGALSVPKRPTLKLTVGATRTGVDSANISAQYSDSTAVINASVTAKQGERHPLVKISSADGVAFSFTDTSGTTKVTKDGAVVAELDLDKGIISYIDGVTESLK